ncbi:GL24725 [Drosophila persimilis]|uniref:GL24725 n=1 Tax=Drosophila persimilis TaxID=7234 RepID=B4IS62_DROPE|nr:GL24725 [Drosophila persimilis]
MPEVVLNGTIHEFIGKEQRGNVELNAARSLKPRPKRGRRADSRSPADRRAAHRTPSTQDPGPGGSEELKAKAACLVSQANVLAAMVPGVCAGITNQMQVAPGGAKHKGRRPSNRRRGQPAPSTVAPRKGGRNNRRAGRKGQSGRAKDEQRSHVQEADTQIGASANGLKPSRPSTGPV